MSRSWTSVGHRFQNFQAWIQFILGSPTENLRSNNIFCFLKNLKYEFFTGGFWERQKIQRELLNPDLRFLKNLMLGTELASFADRKPDHILVLYINHESVIAKTCTNVNNIHFINGITTLN